MTHPYIHIPADALDKDTYLVIRACTNEPILYSNETIIGMSLTDFINDYLLAHDPEAFRVIRFNPVEHTCRDITFEICEKLADYFKNRNEEMPEGFRSTCDSEGIKYFTNDSDDLENGGYPSFEDQHRLTFADYGLRRRAWA